MILVTGISGVGKSYTIEALARSVGGFRYIRASALLTQLGLPVSDLSDSQAIANQAAIAASLRMLGAEGTKIIIDGHAVIETVDGAVDASTSEYETLPITAIVNITDDVSSVVSRRLGKGRRSDPEYVAMLMEAEEASARRWATRQRASFFVVRSGDVTGLAGVVDQA